MQPSRDIAPGLGKADNRASIAGQVVEPTLERIDVVEHPSDAPRDQRPERVDRGCDPVHEGCDTWERRVDPVAFADGRAQTNNVINQRTRSPQATVHGRTSDGIPDQ